MLVVVDCEEPDLLGEVGVVLVLQCVGDGLRRTHEFLADFLDGSLLEELDFLARNIFHIRNVLYFCNCLGNAK